MADLKNVIYLSNEDFATLSATGTVTIGGEVLTYDEDCVYITPDVVASHVEAGLMSPDDKIKLDGIASGAQPGTITGITMNGASKGTSGVVDLGTVVTAETDTLSSVLNRGNQATKDVNMNSKDAYNAGVSLTTYNYSTEQSPNTQYYWYKINPPGAGIGDKYLIFVEGDVNYPVKRGNYILEISNHNGASYNVSLTNLGSTSNGESIMYCAMDVSGYVYVQACVAWTSYMRITRIVTASSTSPTITSVGYAEKGVANGFTPAKIINETGNIRIASGALDPSYNNTGTTVLYAGSFVENGWALSAKYQPLDADLTSIAGLSGTSGLLRKTASNTWSLDTNNYATVSQIPTVNNATLTVSQNGSSVGTFTANASSNVTIDMETPKIRRLM